MKKRILMALVVAMVIFSAFYASAANLIVNQNATIQAGLDADMTCDDDGVFVDGWGYETVGQVVLSVRIGGVDAACQGLEMVVGFHNSAGGDIGSEVAVVPSGGGLVTVSFPGGVDAADIEQISVAISN